MLTQNVATTSEQHSSHPNDADCSSTENPLSQKDELNNLITFFELLSQIDQRLKKEDLEYRDKYYPERSHDN
ncbi:MAG: hypothetical protein OEX81_02790 [Candidatus Pacebacteria bacterium]|nr:hypothetical protein [Candidatus Paceibacterota bacterium]